MKQLINIDVPHLDEATAFYTEAFGLRVGRRFGDQVVELLGGEAPIYLLLKTEGSQAAGHDVRVYARHWTPVHCDVVVDDAEAALARAVAAGAIQEDRIRSTRWGRIVQIADPFGHGWCLLQFVGRGYDEIADPT